MKTSIHTRAVALAALVGALAVPALAAARPPADVLERYAAAHPYGEQAQPAPHGVRVITDTLGGNGRPSHAPGYRFITDTLASRGRTSTPAFGFRLITDTLGGNGGPRVAAAAVAAPIAQASSAPKVDPLAVSYLTGKGLSPSEVKSWTVGACSHQVKAASCYAMLEPTATSSAAKVDPFAVSYLIGKGLSPSEVKSWTIGACSHQAKAASCYAMLEPTAAAAASTQLARSIGFQWDDAGIGAGVTLGIILLLGGAGASLVISRQNRRRQPARA